MEFYCFYYMHFWLLPWNCSIKNTFVVIKGNDTERSNDNFDAQQKQSYPREQLFFKKNSRSISSSYQSPIHKINLWAKFEYEFNRPFIRISPKSIANWGNIIKKLDSWWYWLSWLIKEWYWEDRLFFSTWRNEKNYSWRISFGERGGEIILY